MVEMADTEKYGLLHITQIALLHKLLWHDMIKDKIKHIDSTHRKETVETHRQ